MPVLLSANPAETSALYGCESVDRMQPAAVAKAILGSQYLFSGGGGLLQDKTSARNLTYYLSIIRMAKLMRKKVVVFNQSIGPLSADGEKRVIPALRGVKVIVRDRGSLEHLENMGVKARLGGDPALLLQPTVGLTRNVQQVVIAPRGDVTEANQHLKRVVQQLRAEGRQTVALSFMPEQDDTAAKALGTDEVVSTRDPQMALDVIAGSGFVVGVRLHALILAAAARTPFSGIAYDPKVLGFCTDAGAPRHNISFEPEKVVAEAMRRATPDWVEIEDMQLRAAQSFSLALDL